GDSIKILDEIYPTDMYTNVTPRILSKLDQKIHTRKGNPLNLIRKMLEAFFYKNYVRRRGNPIFSVYPNISPVVTLEQNFDQLLVPKDHVSRSPSDSYYINNNYMLRAHTSAHQRDLIRSGLDAFLVIGDVYRRDAIDATHYPVFHQAEGVRLFTHSELFAGTGDPSGFQMFEKGIRAWDKQETLTFDASQLVEINLQRTIQDLARFIFGRDVEYRWVEAYFPFTHPSWELEVKFNGEWLELLGCGIIEQNILDRAGAGDKVGWAFGIGLERLAMKLFSIPDIRLFWSTDPGFTCQFKVDDPSKQITYKPISQHPHCVNDISFWIPEHFHPNDFYDMVRDIGGDLVEQVKQLEEYENPKTKRKSHCYRIMYRHMERNLSQSEVNKIHSEIEEQSKKQLGVEVR
ncbi:hypothetical protein LOTGIDRAFT_138971, partial [Lottia gigantea]